MKLIVLLLLIPFTLFAENFQGKVIDAETQEAIIGASVKVENTAWGDYTDKDGRFEIKNIKSGNYKILVSYIGYETKFITVEIPIDKDLLLTLSSKSLKTNEIVVSANKRVQAVQEVPISMSLISSEAILQRNITQLDDILGYVPGVEVNQDNVSIRGSSGFAFGIGSRVALLVDGFPLLAGDNGDMKFDALPIYNTERIEVVKGAGSALYGTSALGGVVNLITKDATEDADFRVRAYSGIYTKSRYEPWEYSNSLNSSYGLDLAYNQKFNKLGISASGGIEDDQSYRAYDDSFRWSAFAKADYNFSDASNIELNFHGTQFDQTDWVYWNSLDSATIPPTNTDRSIRLQSDKFSIFGDYEHILSQNTFFNFKSGIFYTTYYNNFPENDAEYRQSGAISVNTELQMNSNFGKNLMMTYGLNMMNNNVSSKTYGNHNQQIWAAYLQGEYSGISDLILTLGSRIDLEKTGDLENDPVISPKFGASYKLSHNFNLRASAGAGFRAPSVAERFSSVSFQGFEVIPNYDLKAEKSWSFELGFSWESKIAKMPIYVDFALFNNEMIDLIEPQFIADQGAVIRFDNVTRARVTGAELGLKTLLFGFLGLESSLTAMEPRDLDLDETLKYRSKFLWYNTFFVALGAFQISGDYRYKDKFENVDIRLGLQVADYDARVPMHVFDLRLSYDLKQAFDIPLKVSLIGSNILDYYYTEMVGNLAPTRKITFQIESNN